LNFVFCGGMPPKDTGVDYERFIMVVLTSFQATSEINIKKGFLNKQVSYIFITIF